MKTRQNNPAKTTNLLEKLNQINKQSENPCRDVVLIFSGNPNTCKDWIAEASIAAEKMGMAFCVLSFIHQASEAHQELSAGGRIVNQAIYGADSIKRLGYSRKGAKQPFSLKPGNADLPVFLFFLDNPSFKRYWLFEDDVRYSGDLGNFLNELTTVEGDLLATHLHDYIPDWTYVHTFESGNQPLSDQDKLLCFLPFFRISSQALTAIHQSYIDGWAGHHELTWPTVLKTNNFRIIDIGGNGSYVTEPMRNKHYLGYVNDRYEKKGSFGVNKQFLQSGNVLNKLWHPVRPPLKYLLTALKRPRNIISWYLSKILP